MSERIGHLAANTELFLRKQHLGQEGRGDAFLFLSDKPANRQLLTMIERRLRIVEFRGARKFYDYALRPCIEGSRFSVLLPFLTNEYYEFNHAPRQLSFLPEEKIRGDRLLREMGIAQGASFVCFHSRDSAYFEKYPGDRPPEGWAYHGYRDCDIRNYLPAAEYLASKNLFAIRMGSVVAKSIRVRHPRVIDYAARFRSDFGDMFLPGHCKFFLGNTAGLVLISECHDVPVAAANFTPMGYAMLRKDDIFIPKKYRYCSTGRFLTFGEVLEMGADLFCYSEKFAAAGIEPVENSAEEILALATEMDARLDGAWVPEKEDDELQERYRQLFSPEHRITGYPSRVGTLFLRENKELLG